MLPTVTQLLPAPTPGLAEEHILPLLETGHLRLEQILSHGQPSPTGFWYDQAAAEWVALLRGTARLEFVDGELSLAAGDALLIPAGCRHRVAHCSTDAIWLALHYQP